MAGDAASDALLRLLAAVAPGTRVLALGGSAAATVEALARLGLDVWAALDAPEAARDALADLLGPDEAARRVTRARAAALGFPDAFAPWASLVLGRAERLEPALAETARVLAPGGWVWAEAPVEPGELDAAGRAAGLAVAQPARQRGTSSAGLYRAVPEGVVA